MLRTNTVFCCHRNEIIARLKEDFGYETRLPLTGPIRWSRWERQGNYVMRDTALSWYRRNYAITFPDEPFHVHILVFKTMLYFLKQTPQIGFWAWNPVSDAVDLTFSSAHEMRSIIYWCLKHFFQSWDNHHLQFYTLEMNGKSNNKCGATKENKNCRNETAYVQI